MSDLPNCPLCGNKVECTFETDWMVECQYAHAFNVSVQEYEILCALVEAGRAAKKRIAELEAFIRELPTQYGGDRLKREVNMILVGGDDGIH